MRDDLISRAAALDALGERPMLWTDDNDYVLGARNQYDMDRLAIETVPSAQPTDAEIQKMQDIEQAMLKKAYECGKQDAMQWIPCSERLPEEDHWLGGSGRQFSEKVMVTIVNHSDEDTWVDMTQTIDGKWACELPKYCKIVAWMPLPAPCRSEGGEQNE